MNTFPFPALWRWSMTLAAAIAVIGATLLPPRALGGTMTYTGSGCTSFAITGTPPTQTISCVGGGGGGGAPVCAPTANPQTLPVGTPTTISANCSNQPLDNSYVWQGTGCTMVTGPTCTVTGSRRRSVTYSITAANAAGTSVGADVTVTWQ